MKKRKKPSNEKGITLVALIITIIVLIILAAVSINTVFKANFINLAIQGTVNYMEAQTDEQNKMEDLAKYLDDAINKIEVGNADEPSGPNSSPEPSTEPSTEPSPDSTPDSLPTGWNQNKVVALESDDGVKIPVPKGFTPSDDLKERRVDSGFVIKQSGTNNEFVWVPTDNTFGKLFDFSSGTPVEISYSSTGYREPDVLTDKSDGDASTRGISLLKDVVGITGADNNEILENWRLQLEQEYNNMKASVATYGGFYIGRYETGNLSQKKAVVEQGNTDIANQNWYTMYQKSKTILEGTEISSSMIWGCQWDATLKWFLSSSDNEVIKYVTNSTGKGNYAGSQGTNITIPTGSNADYVVNNIFDMAGNVSEANCECLLAKHRSYRGGDKYAKPSTEPASYRYAFTMHWTYDWLGCRSILII